MTIQQTKRITEVGLIRQIQLLRAQHELTSILKNFALGSVAKEDVICNVTAVINWKRSQHIQWNNTLIGMN